MYVRGYWLFWFCSALVCNLCTFWHGPAVSLCCFVVYSTRRFVLSFAWCYLFLCFSVLWELRLPHLGKERANLSAFHAFVRFALVWFYLLSLGVWEGLLLVIVTLPGLFSYLLFALSLGVIGRLWSMNDAILDILYSHFSGSNWISVLKKFTGKVKLYLFEVSFDNIITQFKTFVRKKKKKKNNNNEFSIRLHHVSLYFNILLLSR